MNEILFLLQAKCLRPLFHAGSVDPAYVLEQIELQISKVKEEALSRKEILEKVEKWLAACDEESWLEEYNRVSCFHPPQTSPFWLYLLSYLYPINFVSHFVIYFRMKIGTMLGEVLI